MRNILHFNIIRSFYKIKDMQFLKRYFELNCIIVKINLDKSKIDVYY